MKTVRSRLLLAALLASLVAGLPLRAQTSMVPNAMSYQGVLTDANGDAVAPVTPENRNIEFRIYDAATGGTVLWAEAQTVTVFKGNFSVVLGNGTAIGAPSGPAAFAAVFTNATTANLYFGITPQGGAEFAPRQQLLSSAYALRAKQAESVNATAQANGTPSQFNWVQANNLTVSGHTKITGANVIEFGSGVSGKAASAGEIGYQIYSPNTLDIVGAGTSFSNRAITLWAEGGTNLQGPLNFGSRAGQHINLWSTSYGIGIMGNTLFSRVPTTHTFRWYDGGTGFNEFPDNAVNGRTLATLNSSGFNLITGVFTGNGSGLTNISASALPNNYNYLGINGTNVLEFGRGVAKGQDNGSIGYGTFSAGAALDIVGAGPTQAARRINLFAAGGVIVVGPTTLQGDLNMQGTMSQNGHRPWLSAFTNHAIGSQDWTTYFRTAVGDTNSRGSFAWYRGGSHSNAERDAGGGTALAYLDGNGFSTAGPILAQGSTQITRDEIYWGSNAWAIRTGSDFAIVRSGFTRANLLGNSSAGFTFSSDRRLKQDIQPLTGALDGLLALKPSTYHFKSDPTAPLSMGLIAQDVQEIYPELVGVVDKKDGTLGVTYDGLIPVTIAAVQEQQAQIETLKDENADLKARVSALEARLDAVLSRLPAAQ